MMVNVNDIARVLEIFTQLVYSEGPNFISKGYGTWTTLPTDICIDVSQDIRWKEEKDIC